MATSRTNYDLVILAGDVGGTNINLALIGKKGGSFTIIMDRHYKSQEEDSFMAPLDRFRRESAKEHPDLKPGVCCISGAGPVRNGTCVMTNVKWDLNGPAIEAALGMRTIIINDFTAVSYGVVLLDVKDPKQVTALPHPDGSLPARREGTTLVVGAGTGLGVGFLTQHRDGLRASPSEGGHALLPVFDGESGRFAAWLAKKYGGEAPGAEAAVSGQGIANIFAFLAEEATSEAASTGVNAAVAKILALPECDRPALPECDRPAAIAASKDPLCKRVMERFIEYYARHCANLALVFMPPGGLYLAGGIAAKNEALLMDGFRFTKAFERNYREHGRAILRDCPVYIAKDYSISLYGAANAAVALR